MKKNYGFQSRCGLVNNGQDFLAKHQVILSYLIAHRNSLAARKRKVNQIKVLLISSSASEKDSQKLKNKELFIRNGLKKAEEEGHARLLNWYELGKEKPTRKRLSDYLTDNINEKEKLPDIIHFDGHGAFKKQCKNPYCPEKNTHKIFYPTNRKRCTYCKTPLSKPEGFLLFEDNEGNPDYISAERFADLVSTSKPSKPALVVITACKSALAHQSESVFNGIAQSVLREVPAVVATPFNISEDSTTDFVEQFYRALGAKQSLLTAVNLASKAMRYYDYEWYRPVIFLRHDGDEDGYLFELVDLPKTNLAINSDQCKEKIIEAERTSTLQRPESFLAPPLPEHFVERPKEINQIIDSLLNEQRDKAKAVIVLWGPGGYGKTTLAKAICHRYPRIWQRFTGGIFWVALGEEVRLVEGMKKLYKRLTGSNFDAPSVEDLVIDLAAVWGEERCLVVLDDVRTDDVRTNDLYQFLDNDKQCTWLITTQTDSVLALLLDSFINVQSIEINLMQPRESAILLGSGLPGVDQNNLEEIVNSLREIADRLYGWPYLIHLVRKKIMLEFVRGRGAKDWRLKDALDFVKRELTRKGWSAVDKSNTVSDEDRLDKAFSLGFELLDSDDQARFEELVIFPRNIDIPLAILKNFWNLDHIDDVRSLCAKFFDLSLLEAYDPFSKEIIRPNKIMHKYLSQQEKLMQGLPKIHKKLVEAYKERLPQVHKKLVEACRKDRRDCYLRVEQLPDELTEQEKIYLRRRYASHLRESGYLKEL